MTLSIFQMAVVGWALAGCFGASALADPSDPVPTGSTVTILQTFSSENCAKEGFQAKQMPEDEAPPHGEIYFNNGKLACGATFWGKECYVGFAMPRMHAAVGSQCQVEGTSEVGGYYNLLLKGDCGFSVIACATRRPYRKPLKDLDSIRSNLGPFVKITPNTGGTGSDAAVDVLRSKAIADPSSGAKVLPRPSNVRSRTIMN